MKLLKLDFSQKIWLGFGIIIFLLSVSSILALYNLYDIGGSTERVNDNAVPVLKQSNQLQISLLKLAKLSASGYNSDEGEQIEAIANEFKQGEQEFSRLYSELATIVKSNPDMASHLTNARDYFKAYVAAVDVMLQAKLVVLEEKAAASAQVEEYSLMVDDAGAFLQDVIWVDYIDDDEPRDFMEGFAGRVDGLIVGLFNVVEEINRTNDLDYLNKAKTAIADSINGIVVRNENAENNLSTLKDLANWQEYLIRLENIKEKATAEGNITEHKIKQVENIALAREKLQASDEAIQQVVNEFDQLIVLADNLFNQEQQGVIDAVSLGSQSALVAWIVLILLASQNFNSMRKSIKKKMADLAKLNSTGEVLASLLDQNKALEEVLASMHEQTGVAYGSVFLMNEEDKLELKACYPPKQISPDHKPAQFSLGEGVLGKAAQAKKIKFVPNTSKDDSFVGQEGQVEKALLCVPLLDKDVLIGAMNFSGSVKEVVFEDSDYEFASSIARLLVTTIKNIRMREVIEEQNRTLEQKVRERTAELRQKNKDIAVMMANLHQGLFTIIEGGVIHPEYSAFLEEILETKQIANRNFMDVVFTDTNLGSDTLNQVTNAVESLLGVDEMMWDFNSHLLVNEVFKHMEDGRDKLLEFDWVPIINQQTDEIEKIMVTVRDVTELRALQMAAEEQKRELEIIGQILSVDSNKFDDFLKTSYDFIGNCRSLIEKTKSKDPDLVAELFRNMHTVKGNARTYGFSYITDSVHEVEHHYDELRKNEAKEWMPEVLLEELTKAEQDIKRYQEVADEKLGKRSGGGDEVFIDHVNVLELINKARTLDFSSTESKVKAWVSGAFNTLAQTMAQPFSHVISGVLQSVNSLADELTKDKPVVKINDGDVLIRKEIHSMLNNIFMHVLRNSVDHGIEMPDAREAKGKPRAGHINIEVAREDDKVIIEVEDDGKGLALAHIYKKAADTGIFDANKRPDDQAIADLIFSSGFSTAEKVTEISGRGVGMDAVKQFLKESGGGIEVVLTSGSEGDDFRAFKTRVKINAKYALEFPDIK